jgi:hypothetical protein
MRREKGCLDYDHKSKTGLHMKAEKVQFLEQKLSSGGENRRHENHATVRQAINIAPGTRG